MKKIYGWDKYSLFCKVLFFLQIALAAAVIVLAVLQIFRVCNTFNAVCLLIVAFWLIAAFLDYKKGVSFKKDLIVAAAFLCGWLIGNLL